MVEHADDDVHGGAPRGRWQPQAAGWVEVDPAGGGEVEGSPRGAAQLGRADAVRAGERTGEGLVGAVAGVHTDVDDEVVGGGQAVGRPLEQQAAPERAGWLAYRGADEPVEVEARQVRPTGQVVAAEIGLVEAVLDEVEDPSQPVGGAPARRWLGCGSRDSSCPLKPSRLDRSCGRSRGPRCGARPVALVRLAEDAGFEPARGCPLHAFQACALGHYANPPPRRIPAGERGPEIPAWGSDARSPYDERRPLAWRHPAEPPQGRKAARAGGLWRVRGGSLALRPPARGRAAGCPGPRIG